MNRPDLPFTSFPKIPRLSRSCIITEKLDGTNVRVHVAADGAVYAGSKNRWIVPTDDNYGFAAWVEAHADELRQLGPGDHFGEWWGQGIQRGYDLKEKRFSLFNVSRWYNLTKGESPLIRDAKPAPACCSVVPILYRGLFGSDPVQMALDLLRTAGSFAAPFNRPEGVVVYHEASGHLFKKTLVGDEKGKDQ